LDAPCALAVSCRWGSTRDAVDDLALLVAVGGVGSDPVVAFAAVDGFLAPVGRGDEIAAGAGSVAVIARATVKFVVAGTAVEPVVGGAAAQSVAAGPAAETVIAPLRRADSRPRRAQTPRRDRRGKPTPGHRILDT
jgi:hypothetical protein